MSGKDKEPGGKPGGGAAGGSGGTMLTVYMHCLGPGEYRAPEIAADGLSRTVFLPVREGRAWILDWNGPVPDPSPGGGDDPQGDS